MKTIAKSADRITEKQKLEIIARFAQAMGDINVLREDAQQLITSKEFDSLVWNQIEWPGREFSTLHTQQNLWHAFYVNVFGIHHITHIARAKLPQKHWGGYHQLLFIDQSLSFAQIAEGYSKLGLTLYFSDDDTGDSFEKLNGEKRPPGIYTVNTGSVEIFIGAGVRGGSAQWMTLRENLIYKLYYRYATGKIASEAAFGTPCLGTWDGRTRHPILKNKQEDEAVTLVFMPLLNPSFEGRPTLARAVSF